MKKTPCVVYDRDIAKLGNVYSTMSLSSGNYYVYLKDVCHGAIYISS